MTQPLLKLPISRNSEIEFYENFLIYKNEKILCSDIDGIAYLYTKTRHSINFIPTGTSHSYSISIRARGTVHKISFSGQNNQETFGKFVNAIDLIVKPFVIVNLLLDYIKNNKLEIGELTISPEGLYKKRSFFRSPEFLPWNEYFNSKVNKGSAFVLRKDISKKEYSTFYSRTMSSLNAVVLPDVINFIFAHDGVINSETRTKIIERKAELTVASAQDAIEVIKQCPKCNNIVNETQEFCSGCGFSLHASNLNKSNDKIVQGKETASQESTSRYCSNCGKQVDNNSKFCGNCGTAVAAT